MMDTMIKENGVTFKELEKIFFNGYVRLVRNSQKSSWNVTTSS